MVQVAVLGHGVVGSGVVEVLTMNASSITKKIKQTIEVKYILELRDFSHLVYANKFTKDFEAILADKEVSIIVEVMGGVNPAYDFVKKSLQAGKSVVTSNKELVAEKGAELLALAQQNNVNFLFEASVGGGIPIIRPIFQCLAGNKITEVAGILNGTTNFILTKMIEENMSFETALALATDLGYAEADPTADVEGHDAARKIAILASLAFGEHVYPKDVFTEGITNISMADVAYASKAGYAIKLIGQAKKQKENTAHVMVSPAFVKQSNPLAGITDVNNAVLVKGNAVNQVVFSGPGAGKLPTASAVVGDIIQCATSTGNIVGLFWEDTGSKSIRPYEEAEVQLYVRGIGDISAVKLFLNNIAELPQFSKLTNEIAFITEKQPEKSLRQQLGQTGLEVLSTIRILDI